MCKFPLRPRLATGWSLGRSPGCGRIINKRTACALAKVAVAVGFAVLLVIGSGARLRSGSAAFAQAEPGTVQPAPFDPLVIPSDAYLKGAWSAVGTWPLIAAHLVLMPDGRVLSYGTDGTGRQTGFFIYDVWDAPLGLGGGHLTLPNGTGTDLFCGSQLVLPSGGPVFLAGGDNWTGTSTTNTGNNNSNTFDYNGNTLARGNNMNRARWYSTSTMLLNGEVYIQGGTGGADRPEIRALNGTFRLLSGANTSALSFRYPRNFVAPDGRIFGFDQMGRLFYVNTSGAGSVTPAGQLPFAYTGLDSSAAMFAPGRILQLGAASNGAIVIDINGATPTVTPTQSMSSQRRWVTSTLLADGKVLATGGSQVDNQLTGVNNVAEIWNPVTGTWTRGHEGALARLYHSTALLLPDATVLVAGGGAPGPLNNLNAEIYYPPYLFTAAGAPRGAAPDRRRTAGPRDRQDLPRRSGRGYLRQPRDPYQDRLRNPQLEHGAALPGPDVQPGWNPAFGASPHARAARPAGLLPPVRHRRRRRALRGGVS